LDIGKVLQDGLGALGRNFGPFFLLVLLLQGIPSAISAWAQIMWRSNTSVSLLAILASLCLLVTGPMAQGGLTYGTMRTLEDQPTSLADCLKVGSKTWLRLLGLLVLEIPAFIIGFILLIVPGVLLMLRWSVAAPAVVMEGLGIQDAMRRSATLTKDRRWPIFLLGLIYVVVVIVLDLVGIVLGGGLGAVARNSILSIWLSPLISMMSTLVITTIFTALYRQLRGDRDGLAPHALAEVFA
jgi:hypothetical protein